MNSEKFQSLPIRVLACVLLKQHDLRPAAILYVGASGGDTTSRLAQQRHSHAARLTACKSR